MDYRIRSSPHVLHKPEPWWLYIPRDIGACRGAVLTLVLSRGPVLRAGCWSWDLGPRAFLRETVANLQLQGVQRQPWRALPQPWGTCAHSYWLCGKLPLPALISPWILNLFRQPCVITSGTNKNYGVDTVGERYLFLNQKFLMCITWIVTV